MDELFLIGRLIFGGFFAYNGANLILANAMMAEYAAGKGVPAPEAAVIVAGLLILAGGLSLMLGFQPLVGIGCIALFLLIVTPVMHNFWAETGAAQTADMINFTKNVALLGGCLALCGVPRPWAYSVESRRRIAV
jgi:putative oxidoreductase